MPPRAVIRTLLVAAGVTLLVFSPAVAQEPPDAGGAEEPLGAVVVVAHRGASADAPEHTFAAYDAAVAAGADFLECDLQLTADDVLVCLHDTTLDRTTGGAASGPVRDHTLAELRDLEFGSWFGDEFAGAAVVPFEEQLRCYRALDPDVRFYVETKAPAEYDGRMEPLLVEVLERNQLVPPAGSAAAGIGAAPVVVQSFDLASLEALADLAPTVPRVWLFSAPPPEVASGDLPEVVDGLGPNAVAVLADPSIVTRAHDAGVVVHPWTIDDPAVVEDLLDLGVDGFFTNDPAMGRAIVDDRGVGVAEAARVEAPEGFEGGCPAVAGTVTAAGPGTAEPTGPVPGDDPGPGADEEDGPSGDDAGGSRGAGDDEGLGAGLAVFVGALALALATLVIVRRRRG